MTLIIIIRRRNIYIVIIVIVIKKIGSVFSTHINYAIIYKFEAISQGEYFTVKTDVRKV